MDRHRKYFYKVLWVLLIFFYGPSQIFIIFILRDDFESSVKFPTFAKNINIFKCSGSEIIIMGSKFERISWQST